MNARRAALIAVVVLGILILGVWRSGPSRGTPSFVQDIADNTSAGRETMPVEDVSGALKKTEFLVPENEDPLIRVVGEGLNRIGGSIQRDLQIVTDILEAWQTNFPTQGNPVGENHEIMAELMGRNRLRLEFIPEDHPALNDRGELCDRWGTPFMFHQISGTQMEIRSSGLDRKRYTDDDVIWDPQADPKILN